MSSTTIFPGIPLPHVTSKPSIFRRTALLTLVVLSVVCPVFLLGQQAPPAATTPPLSTPPTAPTAPAAAATAHEFPVLLQQTVTAGKTAVGSRVTAKLDAATLMNGTVIPRNATFTGTIVESVAKSATESSRLAIRMDSVEWKNGSAPVQVYLTAWYYPMMAQNGQDLQYGPTQPANRTWNGLGQYPDPNSKVYRPFPGSDDKDKAGGAPDTPSSTTSNRRALMKNVDSVRGENGVIALVSASTNLKLDKLTTYIFVGDSPTAK